IPEIGAESRGKPVAALAIESCDTIWSDDKSALLFATAKPPRSGRILILEFCFYSFTSATVGGLTTLCVLRQWRKTQDSPQNQQRLQPLRINSAAKALILSSWLISIKAAAATPMRYVPPTKLQGRSLSVSIWNSRSGIPFRRWTQF